MENRRTTPVIALRGDSPTPGARTIRLPGTPAGMRITRIGPRRFQLHVSTGRFTEPRRITVAVQRRRAKIVEGLDVQAPDSVRAAVETTAQLLWEAYGHPVHERLEVASPVRSVCRRTGADGTVTHRVRVAWPALAGHHVAEIAADGAITFSEGRTVPPAVRTAVEGVAAQLLARRASAGPLAA